MFREPKPGYEEVMALVASLNPSYPPIATIEAEIRKLYDQHEIAYREEVEAQGLEWRRKKVMIHGKGCSILQCGVPRWNRPTYSWERRTKKASKYMGVARG